MQKERTITAEEPTGNLLLKIFFRDLSLLKYEMPELLPQRVQISMFRFLNSLIVSCVCKRSLSAMRIFFKKKGTLTFNFSVFSKHFLILKTLISTVHVSEFLSPMDFSDVFYVV